jgi:hypothetical protein
MSVTKSGQASVGRSWNLRRVSAGWTFDDGEVLLTDSITKLLLG